MRAGTDTLDEAGAVEILAAHAEENHRALTTGLEPSPRLALPGYDEAAGLLAEEEADQATKANAEEAEIRLPDYDTGLKEVFTSRTEAEKCQRRNSTRES